MGEPGSQKSWLTKADASPQTSRLSERQLRQIRSGLSTYFWGMLKLALATFLGIALFSVALQRFGLAGFASEFDSQAISRESTISATKPIVAERQFTIFLSLAGHVLLALGLWQYAAAAGNVLRDGAVGGGAAQSFACLAAVAGWVMPHWSWGAVCLILVVIAWGCALSFMTKLATELSEAQLAVRGDRLMRGGALVIVLIVCACVALAAGGTNTIERPTQASGGSFPVEFLIPALLIMAPTFLAVCLGVFYVSFVDSLWRVLQKRVIPACRTQIIPLEWAEDASPSLDISPVTDAAALPADPDSPTQEHRSPVADPEPGIETKAEEAEKQDPLPG